MADKMTMRKIVLYIMKVFWVVTSCTVMASNKQKPIVVVIPSYNNAQWYERNLDSVFKQVYENYRVIYIDDCSIDGTYDLVRQYVVRHGYQNRITLICNEQRKGALANHYKAVHMCKDDEIIVNLDGDDWLKHNYVFAYINAIYKNPQVWMTYGSYMNYPSGKRGECSKKLPKSIIRYHAYREYTYITSHLRTFYAGLFKKIKLADLMYQGQFIPVACDMAFMVPMLEMAAGRIKFIDEVLYVYNQANPENHFRKRVFLQLKMAHITRARKRYMPLSKLPIHSKDHVYNADIIICAQQPENLNATLTSIDACISNTGALWVLYEDGNKEMGEALTQLVSDFPNVHFCQINARELKERFLQVTNYLSHDYIILCNDRCIVKGIIDVAQCIDLLEKTRAYGFYLALGKNITQTQMLAREQNQPLMLELGSGLFAWKLKHGEFDWHKAHNMCMTLYKKETIMHCLEDGIFDSLDAFEHVWSHYFFDAEAIGLCFSTSKVVMRPKISSYKTLCLAAYDLFSVFDVENNAIELSNA